MNSLKRKEYMTPSLEVYRLESQDLVLVGTKGKEIFDKSKVESVGHDVAVGDADDFSFSWE